MKPVPKAPARQPSDLWIYVGLAAAVFLAYWRVAQFGFVGYDDPTYVTQNPYVNNGLSWSGIVWAFTNSVDGNWFPLTWLSHMLDAQLFGLDAGFHHLTNVSIHAASTLLLFGLLRRITGARWPSALAAALFGLHPLHVESVAWISERKDVLSAFFWMLTLFAYARYVERPSAARYAWTLAAFALGLMAKPMLVTLPLAMMLLDYWPFARGWRIREKLPFLGLSGVVSAVTYAVHAHAHAVVSLAAIPLSTRIENALISYAVYVAKMLWPSGLAVFYPYPTGSLAAPAIGAGLAIAAVTAAALVFRRKQPYLIVGWLWYLATLAPVIGLIQSGQQARADRYTYLPAIGLEIAVIWAAAEWLRPWPKAAATLAVTASVACLAVTWRQTEYWQDGVALFQRAVDVTPPNYIARFNLAAELRARGDDAEAANQLTEAVRIRPDSALAHKQLAELLSKAGRTEDALAQFQAAAALQPNDASLYYQMGILLGNAGRAAEAAGELAQAIRLDPGNADAHRNLGVSLAILDRMPEAAAEFRAAVGLKPDDASAHYNYGMALAAMGRNREAIEQLSEALRLNPNFAEARAALGEAMGAGK